MKVAGGYAEKGIVVGNTYDKYGSKNPIVRRIMIGFHNAIEENVSKVRPSSIYEIGCGEGYWIRKWNSEGILARGSDFSSHAIKIAIENSTDSNLPIDAFQIRDIYELNEGELSDYELVVCCEVLEHLDDPGAGLAALKRSHDGYFLLSVPREPIWRVLNVARGKYLSSLGNTPGHLQHWSKKAFVQLLSKHFEILSVSSPFPWTMVLCHNK
jgi:2-polyprenyl-3-methyl-5-hydroxy-6-metoxy-1,4-benzoquinol methylase